MSSHVHWLFSRKISNYRIRICIYLFTSFIIEEQNLIISPINNLIVLCEHNQIAIGGQNNRQNYILWLLIYHVHKLNLNQVISYSHNQNIFRGNMLLCLRCKKWQVADGRTLIGVITYVPLFPFCLIISHSYPFYIKVEFAHEQGVSRQKVLNLRVGRRGVCGSKITKM